MLAAAGEVLECFERCEVFVGERLLCHPLYHREPGALWRFGAAFVFSREKSAGQREVGQDADAELAACGDQFALDAAIEQVVLVLRGDVRGESAAARDPMRVDRLPGGEVAMADVADLAGANQIVERLERLMLRRLRVRLMNLVEVDMVRAQ